MASLSGSAARSLWVDTHCHLQLDCRPPGELLERASSVEWVVTPGVDLESSRAAVRLAAQHPGRVLASAGLHPHQASRWSSEREGISELAREASAVGETGLDFYRNLSSRPEQLEAFRSQIELATGLGKPLVVHCRDAFSDVHRLLEETGAGPGGGDALLDGRAPLDQTLSRVGGEVLLRRSGFLPHRRYGEKGSGDRPAPAGDGGDRHALPDPSSSSGKAQRAGLGFSGGRSPGPGVGHGEPGGGAHHQRHRPTDLRGWGIGAPVNALTPSRLSDLLTRHGITPSRRLGQHFLVDPNLVRKVVETAQVGPDDRVLEVGTGVGNLTAVLAETGARVVSYEIDRRLVPGAGRDPGRLSRTG